MSAQPQRHSFTVDDYHRMAEAGILTEGDRVELIEGEVIHMSPIGSAHASRVKKLNRLLSLELGERAIVSVQDPIRLDDFSEPEPDVAVLRPRDDFYAESHPGPGDVLLLVEVSDTSAELDRGVKLPLYAGHGIPEVWIVDVAGGFIEVCRRPEGRAYRERQRHRAGEFLSPGAFPDLRLAVGSIVELL